MKTVNMTRKKELKENITERIDKNKLCSLERVKNYEKKI